jgi:hypothetical protein
LLFGNLEVFTETFLTNIYQMSNNQYNNGYIVGISFISALGGYLFGLVAVISGALPFLRPAFELDAWWEGFLTGSLALGCIVGCLIAGKLAGGFTDVNQV